LEQIINNIPNHEVEPPDFDIVGTPSISRVKWSEVLTIPFVWIGVCLFIIIGIPLRGIYAGWIIERDYVNKEEGITNE